jgi:hypothetical protein
MYPFFPSFYHFFLLSSTSKRSPQGSVMSWPSPHNSFYIYDFITLVPLLINDTDSYIPHFFLYIPHLAYQTILYSDFIVWHTECLDSASNTSFNCFQNQFMLSL